MLHVRRPRADIYTLQNSITGALQAIRTVLLHSANSNNQEIVQLAKGYCKYIVHLVGDFLALGWPTDGTNMLILTYVSVVSE
jgi:hypothetical protein